MKTRDMTDQVLEWTEKLEWMPRHAKNRLINWATSLDWDWVISRQRIFATPIPTWYCKKCSKTIIAEEAWLPVDPRFEKPQLSQCPHCKTNEFEGEKDVMDTWMDSSITCAVHAGWPDEQDMFKRLFPADLQPNGFDIIRTWDYYLLVKHLALFEKAPYKTLLVNGMVRGTDGRMMHKSYGNYVEAGEVLDRYGADALRQWSAAGGSTGNDVPFKWSDLEHGKRFLTKLWNASRFILSHLQDHDNEKDHELEITDTWILSKLEKLIQQTTDAFETYQFNVALESIRTFTWHILCDQYLEAVKHRLYLSSSDHSRRATQYTLSRILTVVLKLLAPFCPYITESIYQITRSADNPLSIHLTEWPIPQSDFIDETIEAEGDTLIQAISTIRRKKSEQRIPLKQEIPLTILTVSTQQRSDILKRHKNLISQVCKIREITINTDSKGLETDVNVELQT
jgi:valyl-tRNA synthetase